MVALTVQSQLTSGELSVAEHESAVQHPGAGAVVSFVGVVREHDHDRQVARLIYEAHPGAAAVLAEIAAEVAAEPAIWGVAVSHRIGELGVGDVALVAAVSTGHRAEAFALCARLVEEVKAKLPVWKHQIFVDGTDEWVNSP